MFLRVVSWTLTVGTAALQEPWQLLCHGWRCGVCWFVCSACTEWCKEAGLELTRGLLSNSLFQAPRSPSLLVFPSTKPPVKPFLYCLTIFSFFYPRTSTSTNSPFAFLVLNPNSHFCGLIFTFLLAAGTSVLLHCFEACSKLLGSLLVVFFHLLIWRANLWYWEWLLEVHLRAEMQGMHGSEGGVEQWHIPIYLR